MQTIYLDISNKGVVPTIYAKQGDVGRKVQVIFMDSGIPYEIPENAWLSVWYDGDSGDGNYTDIGNKSAIVVENNKVTFELITQMLNNDGEGIVCLIMNVGEEQIGSWNIRYLCEKVPGFESEGAKEYYTAFSKAVENISYPDTSLSVSGKAADSRAVGDALKNKLSTDGTIPMTDNLPMGGHKVTGLGTPTADGDAVPLGYANQNFAPASHVKDKNNPHGVTAKQVGARPDTWMPTAAQVGARPSTWTPTAAQVGAALAGYGYGGSAVTLQEDRVDNDTELANALQSVYSEMASKETKFLYWSGYPAGTSGHGWFGVLQKSSDNNGSIVAWSAYGEGSTIRKAKYNGAWQPLEWVNPPMTPGVEYRTTERNESGMPVYCKLISYKNSETIGSDSSVVETQIPHDIKNYDALVRVTGRQSGVYPLPGITSSGNIYAVSRVTSTYICLRTVKNTFDSRTWFFTVYYTKK